MTRRQNSDLSAFFTKATKTKGRFFNSFSLVETGKTPTEAITYALTSKKAVDKRATRRNRARRRLKAAQREVIAQHPLPQSAGTITWALTAGRASINAEWSLLLTSVEEQWLNILKPLS
jgi:ribonuclease P protein component